MFTSTKPLAHYRKEAQEQTPPVIVEHSAIHNLRSLCKELNCDAETVAELDEGGLLKPFRVHDGGRWEFHNSDIRTAKKMVELRRRDLGATDGEFAGRMVIHNLTSLASATGESEATARNAVLTGKLNARLLPDGRYEVPQAEVIRYSCRRQKSHL